MELDDMKLAWQTLDRRLDLQNALQLFQVRQTQLDKTRGKLRRLYWGKIVQILFGDALIYFGIMSAIRYYDVVHLLACSVLVLAYGLLTVIFGGVTIGTIASIDYTAPVVAIQKRVGALQRTYALASPCLGLPWWFLWIAIFVLEMKAMLGIDLFVTLPAFIWINAVIGVAGFVATAWYLRRRNARLLGVQDASDAPRNLRSAKGDLDEISRFEQM
jgi:hypothetical protein